MREILFRAKRVKNCDWIEGDLINGAITQNVYINGLEAKRETVGQYTGLKDINGTKVFEGDIVRCWSGKEEDYIDFRELTGVVEYKAPYWVICENYMWVNAENFEVEGNIFDDAPYSMNDYNEAKEKGLDLDRWSDYVEYFGLGEMEETE